MQLSLAFLRVVFLLSIPGAALLGQSAGSQQFGSAGLSFFHAHSPGGHVPASLSGLARLAPLPESNHSLSSFHHATFRVWKNGPADSAAASTPRGVRIVKSIGFGLVGGGVGFGLGTLAVQTASHPQGEDAGLALIAGGFVGVPILFPLGVHLGNESRGNLALDYIPLVVTGTGTLLLINAGELRSPVPLIVLGAIDLVGTVLIEHLVGR